MLRNFRLVNGSDHSRLCVGRYDGQAVQYGSGNCIIDSEVVGIRRGHATKSLQPYAALLQAHDSFPSHGFVKSSEFKKLRLVGGHWQCNCLWSEGDRFIKTNVEFLWSFSAHLPNTLSPAAPWRFPVPDC